MDVQPSRDYNKYMSPQRGSSRSPSQSGNYLRPTVSTRIANLTRSGELQTGDSNYERSPISGSKMSFALSSSKKTPSSQKMRSNYTDNGTLSSKRQRSSRNSYPVEELRESPERGRSNSPRRYRPFLLSTIVPDLPYDPDAIPNLRYSSAPRLPTEPIRTFGKLERMISSSLQEGINLSASLNAKEGSFFGGELNLVQYAGRASSSGRIQFDFEKQNNYLSDQNTVSSSQNSNNSEWNGSSRHGNHSRYQNSPISSEMSHRTYLSSAQEAEPMESTVHSTAQKMSVENDVYAVSGYPARSAVQRRESEDSTEVSGRGGREEIRQPGTDRSTMHKVEIELGSTPGMHWSEDNYDSIPMREMSSHYSLGNSLLHTDSSYVPTVHREIFTPSPNIPLGILKSAHLRTPPVGPRVVFSDSTVLSGDVIPSYDTEDYVKIRYDMTDNFEDSVESNGREYGQGYGENKIEEVEYDNMNESDDDNSYNNYINNRNKNHNNNLNNNNSGFEREQSPNSTTGNNNYLNQDANSVLTENTSSTHSATSSTLRRGSPPVLVPPRTVPLPHTGTIQSLRAIGDNSYSGKHVNTDSSEIKELVLGSVFSSSESYGSSDPRSVASAIRLYMLMKNWLNKKKIRKNDFNSTDSNNIYRDRNNEKTIPLAEKIKNTRETLDQRFLTYSEAERRPCVALLLHSHVTSLGGYVSSLFGCEEWLRKKIKFLLASEAVAETFSLWSMYAGVSVRARSYHNKSMKRKGFLSLLFLSVNSRKKKKRARNFIKNFDVSFSILTSGTIPCGTEEEYGVLNNSNMKTEKTPIKRNNSDHTFKNSIINEDEMNDEKPQINITSGSAERILSSTNTSKKSLLEGERTDVRTADRTDVHTQNKMEKQLSSPKKLRIKYKNDDSEWSEYDDYNYHGYGKYNEKNERNENSNNTNYRNKEEKTVPNSNTINCNSINTNRKNVKYCNDNNNDKNQNNNDTEKSLFDSFSTPAAATLSSPFNVSITRITGDINRKELSSNSIEEYRRDDREEEGDRYERERDVRDEEREEREVSTSYKFDSKSHHQEDVFDPLFLCLSPFPLPLLTSYDNTPVTPKSQPLPQPQENPIRSPVAWTLNKVEKEVDCVGDVSDENISGIKGTKSPLRSSSNLRHIASQISQAKRELAVRNFIDNKYYENEILNCTGKSIFDSSDESEDNINEIGSRGDSLTNPEYSSNISNNSRSSNSRNSRNNSGNLNRTNSRVVSTISKIFSPKGAAVANFTTVLYGLQDLVFLFQMFRRLRRRTHHNRKYKIQLKNHQIVLAREGLSVWKRNWVDHLKIVILSEKIACHGYLNIVMKLRVKSAFNMLRSLKSINEARKIKNENFAIKIRENKAYMRAFNLLFFPMKLHCFQVLFVNYQEHGIKPEEKALADGHCERKALQNSFSAWLTWREILQLHRAEIHCKISNRAGREDRVSSNSDVKCDSDDTTESQYKDLKDLKSERKIIPSVFISSSPRPIVAVYYLRWIRSHKKKTTLNTMERNAHARRDVNDLKTYWFLWRVFYKFRQHEHHTRRKVAIGRFLLNKEKRIEGRINDGRIHLFRLSNALRAMLVHTENSIKIRNRQQLDFISKFENGKMAPSLSTYASRTSAYALNKKRKILDTNKSDIYTVSEDEEKPKENNGFETQWCLSEIKMRINERNLGSYVRADSLSVTHTIILIERKLFQKLKNKTEQSRKFRTKFEQINRRKMSIFFTCLRKILFCSRSRNQILENGRKFSLVLFISNWKAAFITKKTDRYSLSRALQNWDRQYRTLLVRRKDHTVAMEKLRHFLRVWSAACSATAQTEKNIRKNIDFGMKKQCFSAIKTLFQSVKHSDLSSKKRFFEKLKISLRDKRAREFKLKTVYFKRLLINFRINENRLADLENTFTRGRLLKYFQALKLWAENRVKKRIQPVATPRKETRQIAGEATLSTHSSRSSTSPHPSRKNSANYSDTFENENEETDCNSPNSARKSPKLGLDSQEITPRINPVQNSKKESNGKSSSPIPSLPLGFDDPRSAHMHARTLESPYSTLSAVHSADFSPLGSPEHVLEKNCTYTPTSLGHLTPTYAIPGVPGTGDSLDLFPPTEDASYNEGERIEEEIQREREREKEEERVRNSEILLEKEREKEFEEKKRVFEREKRERREKEREEERENEEKEELRRLERKEKERKEIEEDREAELKEEFARAERRKIRNLKRILDLGREESEEVKEEERREKMDNISKRLALETAEIERREEERVKEEKRKLEEERIQDEKKKRMEKEEEERRIEEEERRKEEEKVNARASADHSFRLAVESEVARRLEEEKERERQRESDRMEEEKETDRIRTEVEKKIEKERKIEAEIRKEIEEEKEKEREREKEERERVEMSRASEQERVLRRGVMQDIEYHRSAEAKRRENRNNEGKDKGKDNADLGGDPIAGGTLPEIDSFEVPRLEKIEQKKNIFQEDFGGTNEDVSTYNEDYEKDICDFDSSASAMFDTSFGNYNFNSKNVPDDLSFSYKMGSPENKYFSGMKNRSSPSKRITPKKNVPEISPLPTSSEKLLARANAYVLKNNSVLEADSMISDRDDTVGSLSMLGVSPIKKPGVTWGKGRDCDDTEDGDGVSPMKSPGVTWGKDGEGPSTGSLGDRTDTRVRSGTVRPGRVFYSFENPNSFVEELSSNTANREKNSILDDGNSFSDGIPGRSDGNIDSHRKYTEGENEVENEHFSVPSSATHRDKVEGKRTGTMAVPSHPNSTSHGKEVMRGDSSYLRNLGSRSDSSYSDESQCAEDDTSSPLPRSDPSRSHSLSRSAGKSTLRSFPTSPFPASVSYSQPPSVRSSSVRTKTNTYASTPISKASVPQGSVILTPKSSRNTRDTRLNYTVENPSDSILQLRKQMKKSKNNNEEFKLLQKEIFSRFYCYKEKNGENGDGNFFDEKSFYTPTKTPEKNNFHQNLYELSCKFQRNSELDSVSISECRNALEDTVWNYPGIRSPRVRMSILELSGNFGNLKILRFAIQKWYQKSAVAAVRKQFAVRHSAHASCKRFLDRLKAQRRRRREKRLNFLFVNFYEFRNNLRNLSIQRKMSTIGNSHFISKNIKRILKIWRKRILKQKYYRLKKDFSANFFEKRMQSLILIQMKISTLCVSKDKNENENENMENPNFLHQEFLDFVANQNIKKEIKCENKSRSKIFDTDIIRHDKNNNHEIRKNSVNYHSQDDFTPSQSGILGVGLRAFLSPNRHRK